MTTTKGIAVVTQAMYHLISSVVHAGVPGAEVTMVPPEKQAGASSDTPRVNLYPIQVVQDPFLNRERLAPGEEGRPLAAGPTVALDLRYLVSFFGPSFAAQTMLAAVELAFARSPYLVEALIGRAVQGTPDLHGSGLEDQQPPVRFSRYPLTLEELSGFWSGFFESPYTLSVVYEASPVILGGPTTAPAPHPTTEVGIGTRSATHI